MHSCSRSLHVCSHMNVKFQSFECLISWSMYDFFITKNTFWKWGVGKSQNKIIKHEHRIHEEVVEWNSLYNFQESCEVGAVLLSVTLLWVWILMCEHVSGWRVRLHACSHARPPACMRELAEWFGLTASTVFSRRWMLVHPHPGSFSSQSCLQEQL